MIDSTHLGSSFDDFLEEEGMLAEVSALALKRVLAWQISQAMETQGLNKASMADAMNTSRSALDRLLDPENIAVTLKTMDRAATVLGKRLRIELVDINTDQTPIITNSD
ncbi:fis family transcriptional regulator [Leptolyngbya sp. Heron Island J]|uniref:XRE family transcriptional regulator n=1 Tax=Leptolyngbya sp. Heron Island J TaxID=1385935 RepID=UPI0003B9ED1E|nr:XRE family transcriptional regulator [Leptolyngbya sp. Heron Island J]ESA35762.1 fis family transcriptional regulator [Leptolyngbya sp. Heron Island J]